MGSFLMLFPVPRARPGVSANPLDARLTSYHNIDYDTGARLPAGTMPLAFPPFIHDSRTNVWATWVCAIRTIDRDQLTGLDITPTMSIRC